MVLTDFDDFCNFRTYEHDDFRQEFETYHPRQISRNNSDHLFVLEA